MYLFEYFHSVTSGHKPLIIWNFQSVYGSLKWTDVVWRSETVQLGEPVQTHIIQVLFTKPSSTLPSQVKEWSGFWYGLVVKQFP